MDQNFLSMDDFADVLNQLESMPNDNADEAFAMTEEELASQRRYEEIIKKHKS